MLKSALESESVLHQRLEFCTSSQQGRAPITSGSKVTGIRRRMAEDTTGTRDIGLARHLSARDGCRRTTMVSVSMMVIGRMEIAGWNTITGGTITEAGITTIASSLLH